MISLADAFRGADAFDRVFPVKQMFSILHEAYTEKRVLTRPPGKRVRLSSVEVTAGAVS